MPAKDIRRQTEDIRPVNFVRPGVVNTALADAITAVGEGALSIDAAIAKEKLGKDLDEARSDFIVGEVQDEYGDPDLQAQLEKELEPFKENLKSLSHANEQGLLRGDRFRLRADAILQSHIAKRPGLGPEMREIHAQFTGGAIIETLLRREQEQLDAALRAGVDREKELEEGKKFKLQRLVDAGYGAVAGLLVDSSPEVVDAEYAKLVPDMERTASTKRRADELSSAVSGVDASNQLNRPVALQSWQAQFDLTLEGASKTLRISKPELDASDEDRFAQIIVAWQGEMAKAKANLISTATRLHLKPEDISAQMAVFADMEAKSLQLLDGTVELEERKSRLETAGLRLQAELQQNQPLLFSITQLEKMGAHETVKYMTEQNPMLARQTGQQLMEFVVNGETAAPATINAVAGGLTQRLLKDMFPKGHLTTKPPDPAAVKLLTDMGKTFVVTPTDQQKVGPYVDWIKEVGAHQKELLKHLDEKQKADLSTAIRLSAHKLLRTGYLALQQSNPGLRGRLTWSGKVGNEPYVMKGGDPDSVEAKALDQANQQMAYMETINLLTALGGYDSEQEAHEAVLGSQDELLGQQNLFAVERAERAATADAGVGATPVAGRGSLGPCPPVGTVVAGHRYKGGGCKIKANWEPVK